MNFWIFYILKIIINICLFIVILNYVLFFAILKSALLYKFNINAIVLNQLLKVNSIICYLYNFISF